MNNTYTVAERIIKRALDKKKIQTAVINTFTWSFCSFVFAYALLGAITG